MTAKKVLIFSRAYQNMAGGVEKMSLDLAKGLSEKGHEVVILSLDKEPNTPFFEWPPSVTWIKIGIGDPNIRASFISRIQRLKAIRNVVKEIRPSIGIGFQVGSFALLRMATLGLGIRTIAAERNSPNLFNYIRGGKTKRIFSNLILFSASRVAVQFESYSSMYPSWLRSKIVVTPNWVAPVALDTFQRNTDTFQILFIGRLTFQKNVMVLINAMSNLPDNFQLTIIGDGPDLKNLESKAAQLDQKVIFLRPQTELKPFYSSANVLCMPSRWEGFPNVVAEALAHGLPVVGFELCSGIPELITNDISGIVAKGMDNSQSLALALKRASMTNFSSLDIQRSINEYSFDQFIRKWEDAFN